MNERIKELEQQATTIEYGVDNGFDRVTFGKEKFAELIIAECVGICLDRHHTWRWDNEPDSSSGPRDCAQSIKEHFGVE